MRWSKVLANYWGARSRASIAGTVMKINGRRIESDHPPEAAQDRPRRCGRDVAAAWAARGSRRRRERIGRGLRFECGHPLVLDHSRLTCRYPPRDYGLRLFCGKVVRELISAIGLTPNRSPVTTAAAAGLYLEEVQPTVCCALPGLPLLRQAARRTASQHPCNRHQGTDAVVIIKRIATDSELAQRVSFAPGEEDFMPSRGRIDAGAKTSAPR